MVSRLEVSFDAVERCLGRSAASAAVDCGQRQRQSTATATAAATGADRTLESFDQVRAVTWRLLNPNRRRWEELRPPPLPLPSAAANHP